jgi:hypothetical protein
MGAWTYWLQRVDELVGQRDSPDSKPESDYLTRWGAWR